EGDLVESGKQDVQITAKQLRLTGYGAEVPITLKAGQSIALSVTVIGSDRKVGPGRTALSAPVRGVSAHTGSGWECPKQARSASEGTTSRFPSLALQARLGHHLPDPGSELVQPEVAAPVVRLRLPQLVAPVRLAERRVGHVRRRPLVAGVGVRPRPRR